MRFNVNGYSDDAMDNTNVYSVINAKGNTKLGVTTGRTFWMRSITITNTHAATAGLVAIYDQAEAAVPAVPVAANQRLAVQVAPANTTMVEFPAPGLQFLNGCSAYDDGNGTFAAYAITTNGYEE